MRGLNKERQQAYADIEKRRQAALNPPQQQPQEETGVLDSTLNALSNFPSLFRANLGAGFEMVGDVADSLRPENPNHLASKALGKVSEAFHGAGDYLREGADDVKPDYSTMPSAFISGMQQGGEGVVSGLASILKADKSAEKLNSYAQKLADPQAISFNQRESLADYFLNPHGFAQNFGQIFGSMGSGIVATPEATVGAAVLRKFGGDALIRVLLGTGENAARRGIAKFAANHLPSAVSYGLAATPIESMAEGGHVRMENLAQGLSDAEATANAYKTVALNAPGLFISNLIERTLMRPFGRGTKAFSPKSALKQIGGRSIVSGFQQGIEEAMQNAISSYYTGKEFGINPLNWSDEQWREFGDAYIAGMFFGGAGGAVSSVKPQSQEEADLQSGANNNYSTKEYGDIYATVKRDLDRRDAQSQANVDRYTPSDNYTGENGQAEGKYWERNPNMGVSFEGAQPELMNAIDKLAKYYYENTGKRLVINAGTNGRHADGEHSHAAGWKVDVVDAGGSDVSMSEDGPLFTAGYDKGPFLDEFIAYGRSLGLGMNLENLGTGNVHLDIALDGTQWDGNGEHAGGFNSSNRGQVSEQNFEEIADDPNFTEKQNEIWREAQYVAAEAKKRYGYDIKPEWIYGQWSHEAGVNFDSPNARYNNNFGGLTQVEFNGEENKQPDGGNYYRTFKTPREYSEAYLNDFLRYYDGMKNVTNSDEFVQVLKDNDYFGGDLNIYKDAVREFSGKTPQTRMKTPSTSRTPSTSYSPSESTENDEYEDEAEEEFKPIKFADDEETQSLFSDFAYNQAENAEGKDAGKFDFFKSFFENDDAEFQNTQENRDKILDNYGEEFKNFLATKGYFEESLGKPEQKIKSQLQQPQEQPKPQQGQVEFEGIKQPEKKYLGSEFEKLGTVEKIRAIRDWASESGSVKLMSDASTIENSGDKQAQEKFVRDNPLPKEYIQRWEKENAEDTEETSETSTLETPAQEKSTAENKKSKVEIPAKLLEIARAKVDMDNSNARIRQGEALLKIANLNKFKVDKTLERTAKNGYKKAVPQLKALLEEQGFLNDGKETVADKHKKIRSEYESKQKELYEAYRAVKEFPADTIDIKARRTAYRNFDRLLNERNATREKFWESTRQVNEEWRQNRNAPKSDYRKVEADYQNEIDEIADQMKTVREQGLELEGEERKAKQKEFKALEQQKKSLTADLHKFQKSAAHLEDLRGKLADIEGFIEEGEKNTKLAKQRDALQKQISELEKSLGINQSETAPEKVETPSQEIVQPTQTQPETPAQPKIEEQPQQEVSKPAEIESQPAKPIQQQNQSFDETQQQTKQILENIKAQETKPQKTETPPPTSKKTYHFDGTPNERTSETAEGILKSLPTIHSKLKTDSHPNLKRFVDEQEKILRENPNDEDAKGELQNILSRKFTDEDLQSFEDEAKPVENIPETQETSTAPNEKISEVEETPKQETPTQEKSLEELRKKLYDDFQVDKFPAVKDLIDNDKLEVENPSDEERLLVSLNALENKHPIALSPLTKEYESLNKKRLAKKDSLKKQFYREKNPISAEQAYQEYEKFLQENSGEKSSEEKSETRKATVKVTGDEFGDYENLKELRQKAKDFYKQNLRGTSVRNPILGEVELTDDTITFTNSGLNKMGATSAQEEKILLVRHLPELIEKADKISSKENVKDKRNASQYSYLRSTAEINGNVEDVNITIFTDANGNKYYNHNIVGNVENEKDLPVHSAQATKTDDGIPTIDKSSDKNITQSEQDGKKNSKTYDNRNDAEEKEMIKAILDAPVGTKIISRNGIGEPSTYEITGSDNNKKLKAIDSNRNALKLSRENAKKYFGAGRVHGYKLRTGEITVVYPENVAEESFDVEENPDVAITDDMIVADKNLTSQQKTFAEIGNKLGLLVKFFRGDPKFRGVLRKGTSYINVNNKNFEQTFYHEAAHYLSNFNPELFNEILETVPITKEQLQAVRDRSPLYENLSDRQLKEEILADNFMDFSKRAGFLREVGKQNKSLAEKLVSWLKSLMDRFTGFFSNPKGGLTRTQREAMYKSFKRNIDSIVDKNGNKIFRMSNATFEIQRANGEKLQNVPIKAPRITANSKVKYSIDPSDNSNESWKRKIRQAASWVWNGTEYDTRIRHRIIQKIDKATGFKTRFLKRRSKDPAMVDEFHKIIRLETAYDFENLLPMTGKYIAEKLNLQPSEKMNNYIAEWIWDGAPTNSSEESRLFEKAMRENPEMAETLVSLQEDFQTWNNMTALERAKAIIVHGGKKKRWRGLKNLKKVFTTAVTDDLDALEKMKQEIEERTGEKIEINLDPHKNAALVRGSGGIAESLISAETPEEADYALAELKQKYKNVNFDGVKPVQQIISEIGGAEKVDDFLSFWLAKYYKELHEKNRKIKASAEEHRQKLRDKIDNLEEKISQPENKREKNKIQKEIDKTRKELDDYEPKLFKTGLSESNCDNIIEQFQEEFGQAEQDIVRFCNAILDIQADSGLVTKKTAERWKSENKHYAPMTYVFDEADKLTWSDSTMHREGSTRDAVSMLETLLRNTSRCIRAAEVNKFKLNLAHLARAGTIGEILSEEEVKNSAEPFISFKENGKVKYLATTPDIKAAVDSLTGSQTQSNFVLAGIKAVANIFRATVTSANPMFAAGNPIRDSQEAYLYNRNGSLNPYHMLKNIAEAYWNVFHAGLRGLGVGRLHPYFNRDLLRENPNYKKFLVSGGSQATMLSNDIDQIDDYLKNITRTNFQKFFGVKGEGGWTRTKGFVKQLVRTLQEVSEITETTTRLKVFEHNLERYGAKRENGIATYEDERQAALDARNATTDFAKGGTASKFFNQYIPFFNPTIQGLAKDANLLKDCAKVHTKEGRTLLKNTIARIIFGTVSMALAQSLYRLAFGKDDDDDEYGTNDWKKNTNWIFGSLSIPKSYSLLQRFFGVAFEDLFAKIFDGRNVKNDRYRKIISEALPSIMPVVIGTGLEAWTNYSFFYGGPIVPQKEEGISAYKQYGHKTSELAKWLGGSSLATFLSEVFLGKSGGISPRRIDYVMKDFGVLDTVINGTINKFVKSLRGEDTSLSATEFPVLNRFMFNPIQNPQIVIDYYNAKSEQEQLDRDYKDNKKRGIKELPEGYDPQLYRRIKSVEKAMKRISEQEEKIRDNLKLPKEEAQRQIDELNRRRIQLCKKVFGYS